MTQLGLRFAAALLLAKMLHDNQVRKATGCPYISHLLGVASLAIENGADEDTAIAALLHDAVEDQGGASTRERIRDRFGDRVVAIIDGCTDTDVEPKPPWKDRKLAHIAHAATVDSATALVIACDKLHNMRSIVAEHAVIGPKVWSHFKAGRE